MSNRTAAKTMSLAAATLALGSAIGANMQSALAADSMITTKTTELNSIDKVSQSTKIDAKQLKIESGFEPQKIDSKQLKIESGLEPQKVDSKQLKIESGFEPQKIDSKQLKIE
jgi:hypothetical protein